MTVRIHLVTVAGGDLAVLPHMLAHYRTLGVQSFFINAHLLRDDDALSELRAIAVEYGGLASVTVGDWQDVLQELYERQRRQYPQDWFVLADSDELQEWPAGLSETIEECDGQGYDSIRGCLIDRLARDGSFPAVLETKSVSAQFPLGAFLHPIHTADPRKVVAVKGAVHVLKGQHHALARRTCPTREHYIPVHHFKWTQGIAERLARRSALLRAQGHGHWVESEMFLRYYASTNGFITLEDPHLLVAECTPQYPNFERVKQLVLSMPRPTER